MTQSETVTLFNNMCLMAPATLIDSAIVWEAIDARTTKARFTNAWPHNPSGAVGQRRGQDRVHFVEGPLAMMRSSGRHSRGGARRQPTATTCAALDRRQAPVAFSVDQSGGESVDRNRVRTSP
jgi:hypothetical protein